jgi:hypothetical protein
MEAPFPSTFETSNYSWGVNVLYLLLALTVTDGKYHTESLKRK